MNRIDPKAYGLHARTVLERIDRQTIALVIDRKSRIIMDDGRRILEKAAQIQEVEPGVRIILKTSAPLCSKTLALLESADVTSMSL